MATKSTSRMQGFTLMELMIAIAVLAILITIAAPSISETIRNNQIAAQNNELIALINLARNEAVRRNVPEGEDGVRVILRNNDDGDGWDGLVVVSDAADADAECNVADAIRCASLSDTALTNNAEDAASADRVVLEFNNRGYLTPFQPVPFTLIHENCSNPRQARAITVTGVGQVDSVETPCT